MKKAQSELDNPIDIIEAALRIDGYYVKDFRFSVRDDLDEASHLALGTGLHIQPSQVMTAFPTVDLMVQIGTHKKSRSKFRVMLQVESSDEKDDSPYTFNITLVGYFSLSGIRPVKGTSIFFHRNAAMLLYSAAREIIASVTGRGPFPAFILPTLAFNIKESAWKNITVRLEEEAKKLEAKKKPRELPPAADATKKVSKKTPIKKPSTKK